MCASVFCEEGTGGSAPGLEKGQSHRVLLLLKHVYCADMRTWVQMPNGHIKKSQIHRHELVSESRRRALQIHGETLPQKSKVESELKMPDLDLQPAHNHI